MIATFYYGLKILKLSLSQHINKIIGDFFLINDKVLCGG